MIDKNIEILFTRNKIGNIDGNNRKKYPLHYEALINIMNFLPKNSSLAQYEWHFINHIFSIPQCKICKNNTSWNQHDKKYNLYCSVKCVNKDPLVLEKRKMSMVRLYGNPIGANSIVGKIKSKETMLKNHGVEHAAKNTEIYNKIKQTNLKRYGTECTLSNPKIKEKIKKTLIKKYGVDNISKNFIYKRKAVETSIKKYGMGSNSRANKKTCLSKYGVTHQAKAHIGDEKLKKFIDNKNWLIEQHTDNKLSLTEIANNLNVSVTLISNRFSQYNINVIRYGESIAQKEINEFITIHYPTITNSRNIIPPFELDIFIPDLNLAIEYNGVLWHSEIFAGKNKNYHLNKLKNCENKNIKLFQIWSTDWKYKKEIIKSKLLQLLNKSNKIYAKKCSIKSLTTSETKSFLNNNQLKNIFVGDISYSLFFNNEIVSVMTFKYNKQQYELINFYDKLNHSVVGGANKLFKQFIDDYKPVSVIAYSDKFWNNENLYNNLGFKYLHTFSPNFYYFKTNDNTEKLYSKSQFQKHKLKDKLEVFDEKLTVWKNMQANGYDRIWDCGYDVFIYYLQ